MMLLLAGAAAAVLAELGRLALVRARAERDAARTWFLAEAGLADTVAAIAPGSDLSEQLQPVDPGPADAFTYTVAFDDDEDDSPDDRMADANRKVLLRVTATGPAPLQRRLRALIGRARDPYLPGAATLAGSVRELTGDFRLDGRDAAMDGGACSMDGRERAKAGLTVPEEASLPILDHPEQISGLGGAPSIARLRAPDLAPLVDAPRAVRSAPGILGGGLGGPGAPQLTVVDGDATIAGDVVGGGVLYVTGRLRVSGALTFTGVVAAGGGVEVPSGGALAVCGALWASGDPALDARGRGAIRASAEANRLAASVAPLPARARVMAVREIF
jgi:hypothetical protein